MHQVSRLRRDHFFLVAPIVAVAVSACAGKPSRPLTVAELQRAEANACVGVKPADRASNPLREREILDVSPLVDEPTIEQAGGEVGAVITVAPEPGLTAEWLQRRAECYAAGARLAGRTGQQDDPLTVPGASTAVRSTGNGFAISISAADPSDARTIIARAEALAPSSVARP